MMHLEAIIEKNKGEDTVTISKKEYERLLAREDWLDCLEAAGVDNWSGFDFAHDIQREQEAERASVQDEPNGMEDGSPFRGRDITASEDE